MMGNSSRVDIGIHHSKMLSVLNIWKKFSPHYLFSHHKVIMGNIISSVKRITWGMFSGNLYGSKYFTEEQMVNAHNLYTESDRDPELFSLWIDNLIDEYPTFDLYEDSDLIRDGAGPMLSYLYHRIKKDNVYVSIV